MDCKIIEYYVKNGIKPSKINISKNPSTTIWSTTRNCIVGEKGLPPAIEFFNGVLTYDNNILVNMISYIKINADEINKSNGIVVSSEFEPGIFRFWSIPD